MQIKQAYKKLKSTAHMFSTGQWDRMHRGELVLLYPVWLVYMVIQELIRDRGLVRASALAFTTVLSVVPVVAVATVLLKAFGGTQDKLLEIVQNYLLPFAGPEIIGQIQSAVEKQVNAAGGIGAIVLIVLGLMLFNHVEHAFNDIWRIKKQRPLLNKFLTFYALITLAPLLVTISIVQTAQFHVMVEAVPFMASLGYKAASIGIAWVLFALANKLLPYTRVNWVPAIVSGLVVALAFELAKTGFNFYVTSFVLGNYQKVYGAIYLIPIFLLWVYICWVIVLFGAELAYTIQNLKQLMLPDRLQRLNLKQDREYNPLIGLEVFYPVAMAYKSGKGPLPLESVAAQASIPVSLAREVLDALRTSELVLRVSSAMEEGAPNTYLPARPLRDIPVMNLILACRRHLEEGDEQRTTAFIASIRKLHQVKEEELFQDMTAAELVDPSETDKVRLFARSITADLANTRKAKLRDPALVEVVHRAQGTMEQLRDTLHTDSEPAPEEASSPIDTLAALNKLPAASPAAEPDTTNPEPADTTGKAGTTDTAAKDEPSSPAPTPEAPKADPFAALAEHLRAVSNSVEADGAGEPEGAS